MKYFQEKKEEEIFLSTYKKELVRKIKGEHIKQDEIDLARVDYLISLFGDIELEESLIKEFVRLFSIYGGRYSVRTSEETLTDLLQIKQEIPALSTRAISELSSLYIRDLFEEYHLKLLLHALIESSGKDDKTFELFLDYVDEKGKEQQRRYDESAEELKEEILSLEYVEQYADYLSHLVRRKHISKEEILKHLPDKELVLTDLLHLIGISKRTRIYLGMGEPISFTLTEEIIKDEELSKLPEDLFYHAEVGTFSKDYPATFTKSEFIESTKKIQKRT